MAANTNEHIDIIAEADLLYRARSDISQVKKSVELLRSANKRGFEVSWRLARSLFFLGQEAEPRNLAPGYHREGIKAARQARKERPERVEAHFWLGVNLALLAQTESTIMAIAHALQAKRALSRSIDIDPGYHAAGPLRVIARLQHKLPSMLGGGALRARENYERALSLAPENTVTRIYFAELLQEMGSLEEARRELEAVLRSPFYPTWAFEIERDNALAQAMLKNMKL